MRFRSAARFTLKTFSFLVLFAFFFPETYIYVEPSFSLPVDNAILFNTKNDPIPPILHQSWKSETVPVVIDL